MGVRVSLEPPSPQDGRQELWRKLRDIGMWTTGTGEPDTDLLGQIRGWPNCWPELTKWIDGIISGGHITDPPAPPKLSLGQKLQSLKPKSRTKAIRRRRKLPPVPLPPVQPGSASVKEKPQMVDAADSGLSVRRTLSWQNVRKPLVILAAIFVVLAVSFTALDMGMHRTTMPKPAVSASKTVSRRKPDPRRKQALSDLTKSISTAEKYVNVSVSDPETISALKTSISEAEKVRISRRIALTEIQKADEDLTASVKAVKASQEKLESDKRKKAEEAKKQEDQRKQEEQRKAEEAQKAEEQRKQETHPAPVPTPRRSYQAPRRTYVPRRQPAPRTSRPSAPRRQQSSQPWNVPGTGCTEGCL